MTAARAIEAAFFDRDETLIEDVPYNGDPARVVPLPGVKAALDRLRAAGIPLAVITNQSGVGRGLITAAQVDAVNRRVDELLGPFAGWFVCPHAPDDDCDCRKPKPKLLLDAARALGVDIAHCVMVGDKASDAQAAQDAGALSLNITPNRNITQIADIVVSWRA